MTHTVFVKLMRQTFATAAVEIVSFMALNILLVEYFCIDYNKIQIYVGWCTCNNWASSGENPSSGVGEQHRRRPACASAQSGQRLCFSLFGKYDM